MLAARGGVDGAKAAMLDDVAEAARDAGAEVHVAHG